MLRELLLAHAWVWPKIVCAGALLIALEFCRPGWVAPVCLGGLLLVAGLFTAVFATPVPFDSTDALLVSGTVVVLAWLLQIAYRARRNKRPQMAVHQRHR